MKILITGVAGFIGYNLAKKLIKKYHVIGIDNINSYYSVKLKKDRIKDLKNKNFKFYKLDITQKEKLFSILEKNKITHIVHLAAQAGVRYSLKFQKNIFVQIYLALFLFLSVVKN